MSPRYAARAGALHACSGCAGDYEDPEHTARADESGAGDGEHEDAEPDARREFPGKANRTEEARDAEETTKTSTTI